MNVFELFERSVSYHDVGDDKAESFYQGHSALLKKQINIPAIFIWGASCTQTNTNRNET